MKAKRWLVVGILSLAVAGFILSACSSPPDKEIAQAEEAIKNAVAAGADAKSPKLVNMAREALNEAKTLTDQGHYKEARKKALSAANFAEMAERYAGGPGRTGRPHKKEGEEHE